MRERPTVGKTVLIIAASFLLDVAFRANAFFSPEVVQSYRKGEPVPLVVNKMTSTKTLLPIGHYELPFCRPKTGPKRMLKNSLGARLGERLVGDQIESSPYRLTMMEDVFCKQVCLTNLGRQEEMGHRPNKMVKAIRRMYHNNWFVDGLPVAFRFENDQFIATKYWGGFPVGFVGYDGLTYVYNHVNIEIRFHRSPNEPDKARVVKVIAHPVSIPHNFVNTDSNNGDGNEEFKINNPIESCDSNSIEKKHTSMNMFREREPQPASGTVLFTYDVTWIETQDAPWSSRWDTYLSMDNAVPFKVHLYSVMNSLFCVFFLLNLVFMTYVRFIQNESLSLYVKLESEEMKEELLAENVWKLAHADVFRPPKFSPFLLSVVCGTGAQLIATAFLTIIFLILGYLTPRRGGDIALACLVFYAIMGIVGGYVCSRVYRTFRGRRWKDAAAWTALLFPTVCSLILLMTNCLPSFRQSTYAMSLSTMFHILLLHGFICIPLVFYGAYIGYKKKGFQCPVNINSAPRKIPKQPWPLRMPFALVVGGVLPFAACIVECYFVLATIWLNQYYNAFGFLLLVFLLVYAQCAGVCIFDNFLCLQHESYQWWWRSFSISGSVSLYLFLYSMYFLFHVIGAPTLHTVVFYAGSMFLVSFAVFLMTGYVGFSITYMLNFHIFSTLKAI